jgi:hypothetical protein
LTPPETRRLGASSAAVRVRERPHKPPSVKKKQSKAKTKAPVECAGLPPKITAFLAAIRVLPCIERAAKAAGINKAAHYAKLHTDQKYAKAFSVALQIGIDAISDVAVERAAIGWEEPVIYQGAVCYPLKQDKKTKKWVPNVKAGPLTVRRIDNRLVEFVLKNRHPEYRERVEVSGELSLRDLTARLNAGRQRVAAAKASAIAPTNA